MKKNLGWLVRIFLVYTLLCIASFLMLRTIITYSSFEPDIQFLALKQDYINIPIWKAAFYIHVFSAIFTLFAGFTQFSEQFLKEYRKFHVLLGRLYVWNILLINFPAGMIMAVYANGGAVGKASFILLDILWFLFTLKGFTSALKKDFKKHEDYMIRSYCLTFSAISLRTWKIIMTYLGWVDLDYIYIVDSWLALVLNLILAEWIVRNKTIVRKQLR